MAPGPRCTKLCSYFYSQKYFQLPLEELPVELFHQILHYLPKDSLANLRLASRALQERVTACLYRQFTLRYTPASVAKAREIMKRPDLAHLVREFRFDANPSQWYYATYSEDIISREVRTILRDLQKFHRICSFSISFGRTTTGRFQGEDHTSDVYPAAFSYLLEPQVPFRLYSLSMEKAPCHINLNVTSTPVFRRLLRNLRVLDFNIISLEPGMVPPISRKSALEAIHFHSHFPKIWLEPASQHLTILHLSADAPWGWHPKADFREILFPNIEELTLSRFTFSHDWQLQWLVRHANSLKRLRLIECHILDHAMSIKYGFNHEGYPLLAPPNPKQSTSVQGSYRYRSRWSDYFKTFATSLPLLQSFSLFAPDHVYRRTSRFTVLDEEAKQATQYNRYAVFTSCGFTPLFPLLPSIFPHGAERINQDKEDAHLLTELLATVWQRCRRL